MEKMIVTNTTDYQYEILALYSGQVHNIFANVLSTLQK